MERLAEARTSSHQTVRLAKGKHRSPGEGACVMELVSMLAGERFSDHPRSASPTIAGFLRAYNDVLDDERRQDLYAYAAKVVGTRASRAVEQRRARRVAEWASGQSRAQSAALRWVATRAIFWPLRPSPEQVGAAAARKLRWRSSNHHRDALQLVDELVAMGRPPARCTEPIADEMPEVKRGPRAPSLGAPSEKRT